MVDVSAKDITSRYARAEAVVRMNAAARTALREATLPQGRRARCRANRGDHGRETDRDADSAGASAAAGQASTCASSGADDGALRVEAEARTSARTGVEMEAMVAASIAALTIYDMAKALDKGITIESLRLLARAAAKRVRGPDDEL